MTGLRCRGPLIGSPAPSLGQGSRRSLWTTPTRRSRKTRRDEQLWPRQRTLDREASSRGPVTGPAARRAGYWSQSRPFAQEPSRQPPPMERVAAEPILPARAHARRRTFLRNRLLVAGAVLVGTMALVALLAPLLASHDPFRQFAQGLDANGMPRPPDAFFRLGTDSLGRDVLS